MNADRDPPRALANAMQAVATALHDIDSRTDPARIAAEVVRLNDAVRHAVAGRIGPFGQPADFAALLLERADPVNTGASVPPPVIGPGAVAADDRAAAVDGTRIDRSGGDR